MVAIGASPSAPPLPTMASNERSRLLTALPPPSPRLPITRFCGVRRSTCLLSLYVVFYCFFLVLGAVFFMLLEGHSNWFHEPAEANGDGPGNGYGIDSEFLVSLADAKSHLLAEHSCISDEDLEEFIVRIIEAHKRGVSAVKNATMEPNWSFGQSLFFSATVITTIGYGHVTPLSEGGKIFCIVYALLGIPLTLVLLTAFVERLIFPTTWFLQFLNSRLGHLYQPFNIRMFHLTIVVTLVVILFYIIPSVVFTNLEPEWTFLDSLYYCIISLTTIGLGDYVPGDTPDQPYRLLYKICITVYLLIGLTFMMLVLTVFYDIPQLNFGLFFLLRSDEHSGDNFTGNSFSYSTEKTRLHGPHSVSGPKYTPQIDENIHHSIRVKSRSEDLSSPEDGRP